MEKFIRLKVFSALLLLLLLVQQGWGQCGTYQVYESVGGAALPTQGGTWVATSMAYTGTPRTGLYAFTFDAVNDAIRTPLIANPGVFSFWYRRNGTTTGTPQFTVQTSPDNATWTTRGATAGMNATYQQLSINIGALGLTNVYIRILDTRASGTAQRFVDDVSWTSTVASANTAIISSVAGGTTTCSSAITCGTSYTFTDQGSNDEYNISQDHTVTFTPSTAGQVIRVVFSSFSTESGYDGLVIYNGATTSSPTINSALGVGSNTTNCPAGSYYGTTSPGTVQSTDASGALTFRYRSDISTNSSGWVATVTCVAGPTCAVPSAVNMTAITGTTATINWTAASPAPSNGYEWEVRTSGAAGSGATGLVTSGTVGAGVTTASVTGLTQLTSYNVYVRSNCGGSGTSTWTSALAFNTPCGGTSCGYVLRLRDSYGDGWNSGTMQVRQNGVVLATLSLGSGAGPVDQTVSLCTGVGFNVFWNNAGSFPGEMMLEVIDPFGVSLYTMPANSNALAGTTIYTGTANCTPPACVIPSALVASAITATTATLSWTASPSGPSNGYDIYYSLSSTAPTGATAPTIDNNASTSVNLTGLTSNSTYYVWVRADCGPGNNSTYSTWVALPTFRTKVGCGDTFTDTGGAGGNYADGENMTWTICPSTPGDFVTANFTSFVVETCCDEMAIYDGNSASSAPVSGSPFTTSPGSITSTDATGCLTFVFTSDGSINYGGWSAGITCSPPPACPAATALSSVPQTPTSTLLTWTGAGDYIVEYGAPGFAPGTGATAGAGTIASSVATTPYLLTGLTAGTTYDIYIRQVCAGPLYSNNSTVVRFLPGEVCANAIDLATLVSPYAGNTTGYSDNYSNPCSGNTSPDMVFSLLVPNGATLVIGQTINGYDSENYLGYGGACPGTTQIACYDDPDVQNTTWVNTTGADQTVYWVQDGYFDATNFGTFTLAWTLTIPCVGPSAPTANNSIQCGSGIPTASVTSTSGAPSPLFFWYASNAATTPLQTPPLNPVLQTYYTNDFSSASVTAPAAITGANTSITGAGVLELNPNTGSQNGGFIVNASGINSNQYQVRFDLTTVGGTNPADGFSYSLGSDVLTTSVFAAENGSGTGLKIGFVSYTNGTSTQGIYLMYNCTTDEQTPTTTGVVTYSPNTSWFAASSTVNSGVVITINAAGQLTLIVGGTTIFNNQQLPAAYVNANHSSWAHLIRSRTGGETMGVSIDNLSIEHNTYLPGTSTYLSSVSTTTTFYVAEASGTCEGTRTPVTVTVNPLPAITLTASPSTYCTGSTSTISAVVTPVGTYSYAWSANTNGGTSATTTATLAGGTNTYVLTATNTTTGCTASNSINVIGSPAVSDYTICQGATVPGGQGLVNTSPCLTINGTLTASGSGGATNGVNYTAAANTPITINFPVLPAGAIVTSTAVTISFTSNSPSFLSEVLVRATPPAAVGAQQSDIQPSSISSSGTETNLPLGTWGTGNPTGAWLFEFKESFNDTGLNPDAVITNITITVSYTIPSVLQWFTNSAGGSSISSSTVFNPVGVVGSGLSDTNTPGTYTYYAQCSSQPCRVPVDFIITPGGTTPVVADASGCGAVNLVAASSGAGTVEWYASSDRSTPLLGTGNIYTTSTSGTYYAFENVGSGACYSTGDAALATVSASTVGLTGSPLITCGNSSVNFTASGAGLYEYFVNGASVGVATTTTTYNYAAQPGDLVYAKGYPNLTLDGTINSAGTEYWGSALVTAAGGPASCFAADRVSALYFKEGAAGTVNIGLAGNLDGSDRIVVFIDSKTGGANNKGQFGGGNTSNAPQAIQNIGANVTFDAGFDADYAMVINAASGNYYVDLYDLQANVNYYQGYITGASFDNSGGNAGFKGGFSANANETDYTHGWEIVLPNASLGRSEGNGIAIFPMVTNNGSSYPTYISNHFLSPAASAEVCSDYGNNTNLDFGTKTPNPVSVSSSFLACNNTSPTQTIISGVQGNVALAAPTTNGVVLAETCVDNGWVYYSNPSNNDWYFAVNWNPNGGADGNSAQRAAAQVTVDVSTPVSGALYGAQYVSGTSGNPGYYRSVSPSASQGTFAMQRYWNVNVGGGALPEAVNVRFYYDPAEYNAVLNAAQTWSLANGGYLEGPKWFKTMAAPDGVNNSWNPGADLDPNTVEHSGWVMDMNPLVSGYGYQDNVRYVQFNGVTSFSGGGLVVGVGNGNALPLELLYFTGTKDDGVSRLSWATANEHNTSHFVVERSRDGINFTAIGQVTAAGSSTEELTYHFNDVSPMAGDNYYRLRSVDVDNSFTNSNIINLNYAVNFGAEVYPNPFQSSFTVDIFTEQTTNNEATIELFDLLGRTVQTGTVTIGNGRNSFTLDNATLTPGTYMLKITSGNNTIIRKIVKNEQ